MPRVADLAAIKRPVSTNLVGAIIVIRERAPVEFDYVCRAEDALPGFTEKSEPVMDAKWHNSLKNEINLLIANQALNDPVLNYLKLRSIEFANSRVAKLSTADVVRYEVSRAAACEQAVRRDSTRNPSMVREALRSDVTYKFEKDQSATASMIREALGKLGGILGFSIKNVATLEGRGQQVVFAIRDDPSLLRADARQPVAGTPSVPLTLQVVVGGSHSFVPLGSEPLSLSELISSLVPTVMEDLDGIAMGRESAEEMAVRMTRINDAARRLRLRAMVEGRNDVLQSLDVFGDEIERLRAAMAAGITAPIQDVAERAQLALRQVRR